MDRFHEELDDAKAEIEKLKAESRVKAEQLERLKRAHNEQLAKIQETGLKLEKHAQELNAKADEISVAKQMCEDLKCDLKEKEAIIKHLSSANDKLRMDCHERIQKCEEENRELVFSLDEENAKIMDREQKICALKEEIESLKGLLSVSQKKCSEVEKMAKKSEELRQRDDVLSKIEEENGKLEEQLKWKKEQFKHLEEAHEKLRDQLRARERELEKEKSILIDDISTLQTNLDSQTRISKDLQSQLQMCNQALAREESRRKNLEAQLSEFKTCFGNIFAECEEAKSKLEYLTGEREKEIATLRDLLGTKEILYKETDYKLRRLEQENQELKFSLKELQEAQIQEAGTHYSMSKLQNKLKGLEKIHGNCSKNFKAKEAEWSSRLDNVNEDLNHCMLELESKDAFIKELRMELESSNSLIMQLTLQNEESSVMLLVLKSELTEAQLKVADEKAEMNLKNKGGEENVEEDLNRCRFELESKDALIKELIMELQSSDSLIMQLTLQNEESSVMLLVLKSVFTEAQLKLADEMAEMDLKNKEREENFRLLAKQLEMKNIALVNAQTDLAAERKQLASLESLNRIKQQQLPLQKELDRQKEMLKESSVCELRLKEQVLQMKSDLEEACDALDRADGELTEKFREGTEVQYELQIWKSIAERLKSNLEENHQMRREIEASLLAQIAVEVNLKEEKECLVHVIEEKERRLDDLQQKLLLLEQELKTREEIREEKGHEWVRKELEGAILAQLEAEIIHKHEKESLHGLVEERDRRIDDLESQIQLLREAWEKTSASEVLRESEIQEKFLMVLELENVSNNLQQKLDLQEKQLEAELDVKQLEVKKLDEEKINLVEDIKKLSSERGSLLGIIGELSERMEKFYSEEMELMGMLGGIVQNFDEEGVGIELEEGDELFDPVKENTNIHRSPGEKKVETSLDERSPLRALNN